MTAASWKIMAWHLKYDASYKGLLMDLSPLRKHPIIYAEQEANWGQSSHI